MMSRFTAVVKCYFISDPVHCKLQNTKTSLSDAAPVPVNRSFTTVLCDSKIGLEMCIFQIHLDTQDSSLS